MWMLRQTAFVELHFIPLQSPEVARRFPGLSEWPELDLREKLVVVSDAGAVYQGQSAWIMCLYALQYYRDWAQRLAQPALLPFARLVCELVSKNRLLISRFFKLPATEMEKNLRSMQPPAFCKGESCRT
jgi:hypothetical protein